MNTRVWLMVVLGTLLFASPAFSAESCAGASRAASKAAQDYRSAAAKVRTACDSSSEECQQLRAEADAMLDLVVAANEAMQAACTFTGDGEADDSLPVTAETVAAAIDSLPESVLVPCSTVGGGSSVEIGCPNGWVLNLSEADLAVSSATTTSFNYAMTLHLSGSIPIQVSVLGVPGSCTLTIDAPEGIPVTGVATFSSSLEAGPLNRLALVPHPVAYQAVQFSGCTQFPDVVAPVLFLVSAYVDNVLSVQFCGATGPELFGPCP